MGNPPPQILNLAQHGHATTAMLSWENQQTLQSELEDGSWLNPQTNLAGRDPGFGRRGRRRR